MEQRVKEWLEGQRDQGVKCLEVKMQGESHYSIIRPLTEIRHSKYLGMLDPDKGLIKSGGRHRIHPSDIRNITEYGNSMLLHETMRELKPLLKEDFLTVGPRSTLLLWCASLAMYLPFKTDKRCVGKLYNAENMRSHLKQNGKL
ncbi:hypothetical protein C5S30_06970 [ANME-1 cluster archaeon GoMg4]|nr:hypothetical protein [ANME-1 cluster archaeon GoMg4]